MAKVCKTWGDVWKARKKVREKIKDKGEYRIIVRGNRFTVVAPLSFKATAEGLQGYWRYRTETWTFKLSQLAQVSAALQAQYGKGKS